MYKLPDLPEIDRIAYREKLSDIFIFLQMLTNDMINNTDQFSEHSKIKVLKSQFTILCSVQFSYFPNTSYCKMNITFRFNYWQYYHHLWTKMTINSW